MTYHPVIRCAGHGCPAHFLGAPADAFGRREDRRRTVEGATAAGWHRTWDHRGRERWTCPDCRPDRAGGLGAALPAAAIPADCPF